MGRIYSVNIIDKILSIISPSLTEHFYAELAGWTFYILCLILSSQLCKNVCVPNQSHKSKAKNASLLFFFLRAIQCRWVALRIVVSYRLTAWHPRLSLLRAAGLPEPSPLRLLMVPTDSLCLHTLLQSGALTRLLLFNKRPGVRFPKTQLLTK